MVAEPVYPIARELDKGREKVFDGKSVKGINGAKLFTRAPQVFSHFMDSADIASTRFVATETGAGTGKALFVATAAADGGTAVGVAGATSGNAEELAWALAQFKPSTMATKKPLVFEARVKQVGSTTPTDGDMFLGLHKLTTSTGTAGRLAVVAANSALSGITASDEFAGFAYSSVATSGALFGTVAGLTIKAGTGTLTTLKNAPADPTAFHIYRVEVDVNGTVALFIDDKFAGQVNAGVTPSVALTPYFDCVGQNSHNATMTIDYVFVGGDLA